MAYYEGIDYNVRLLRFPNDASEGLIVSNGDGTFTILLNTRFPESVLRKRLQHELRHMAHDHLYDDAKPIWVKEAEADGVPCPPRNAPATSPALPRQRGGRHAPLREPPEMPAALHPVRSEAQSRPSDWTPYRPGADRAYISSWQRAIAWAERMRPDADTILLEE